MLLSPDQASCAAAPNDRLSVAFDESTSITVHINGFLVGETNATDDILELSGNITTDRLAFGELIERDNKRFQAAPLKLDQLVLAPTILTTNELANCQASFGRTTLS